MGKNNQIQEKKHKKEIPNSNEEVWNLEFTI
jgi:hypothetical protein